MSYNYENNKYNVISLGVTTGPGPGGPYYIRATLKNTVHRAGITAKLLNSATANWLMGVNAASSSLKTELPWGTSSSTSVKRIWTGGLVNRFQYRQLMLGLDVLYAFNYQDNVLYQPGYYDAISLYNAYVGYQLKLKNKPLDIFVQARNPFQKDDYRLPDRRQFYGAGFKATI